MANQDQELEMTDWELHIVRRLDGELAPDDELALDRELIRAPQTRRMADEYGRIDGWAGEALDQWMVGSSGTTDLFSGTAANHNAASRRLKYSRAWWLLPAAIAAALGFVAMTGEPFTPIEGRRIVERPLLDSSDTRLEGFGRELEESAANSEFRRASTDGKPPLRSLRRNVDRNLLGVVGDDGNIYWLEVDRMRTVKEQNRTDAVRLAAGAM